MKKLMTMMSAVAVALGLYANAPEPPETGTSFEGIVISEGSSVPYDIYASVGEWDPQESGTYWETNETAILTVTDCTGTGYTSIRPDRYSKADQNRYLNIKTTLGHPVRRNVKVDGTGTNIPAGDPTQAENDSYYFDSLVKFTAFDSEDSVTNSWNASDGAKLAIWLKENEGDGNVPPSTNLMITAGYLLNDSGTSVMATNYECIVLSDDVNLNDGGWHRVSVRAINNIYTTSTVVPGFIVYVDNKCVAVNRETPNYTRGIKKDNLVGVYFGFDAQNAVFPSAVQGGAEDKSVIRSVDFDGQGDVDDLVFTSEMPECMKTDVPTVFAVELGSGVESVELTAWPDGIGVGTPITNGTFNATYILSWNSGLVVEINAVNYRNGYMEDGIVTNGLVTVQGNAYVPEEGNTGIEIKAKPLGAMVVVGDATNRFENAAQAFDYINTNTAGNVKFILNASAVGGIELDNSLALVELDLAGKDITGVAEEAAISVINGELLITNSTEEVGHVVGVPAEGEEPDPAIAVSVEGGFVTLAGGCFDGLVTPDEGLVAITGAAKIRIAENEEAYEEGSLAACVPDGSLEAEPGVSPVYYVVVAAEPSDTVLVNFVNGDLVVAHTNIEVGAKLVAPEDPEKEGYRFRAWVTTDDPAVDWDFDVDTVEEAMTLVADFVKQYAVTFDSDGGSYTPEGMMVDDGDLAYEPSPEPTKAGYKFKFWALQGETTEYDFTTPVTDDITLVAQWTAIYTITYLNEDGTAFASWASSYTAPASYTVEDAVTLPTASDLDLDDGVSFVNWTNETGTVTGWAAGATGNVTVYAQLDAVVPTPTIDPEKGTTTVEVEAESAAGAIAQVKIVAPEASGIDTPEEQAAYEALFDITAEPILGSDGKWEVTIALKDSVVTGVNTDALAVFSGDTSVAIPQGLYYRVTPSTSLPIASSGEGTLSTGSAITVTKPGTTQGFLKVELSASPIPAPPAE